MSIEVKTGAEKFGEGEFKLLTYDGGGTPLDDCDIDNLPPDSKWIAYAYSYGSYEGSGYAVVAHDNGKFSLYELGHCSCYGPLDNDACEKGLSRDNIESLIGRDFNGREINPDWHETELLGMWEAVKLALHLNQ